MKRQKKHIVVADTTLRDGEQAPGFHMTPKQKMVMARQLAKMGVDVIEAGFPASSPADFEAVSAIAKKIGSKSGAPMIGALARSLVSDIDKTWAALKWARKPLIHTFISSSDIHLKHKLHMSRAEAIKRAVEGVQRATSYTPYVQFSPEDASRSDRRFLVKMLEAVIAAGASVVNITDTVGYATPDEFADLVRAVRSNVRNIRKASISVHCHNDLGLAVANSLAAVRAGATQVECTVAGIGERAGNCALEEFVMACRVRNDIYGFKTNVDAKEIFRSSQKLANIVGHEVPWNKPIVGRNAFSHASGVHQDGVLQKNITYEIMKPSDVGRRGSDIVLTSRSGSMALFQRMKNLGIRVDPRQQRETFQKFKVMADYKRTVSDQDLRNLL